MNGIFKFCLLFGAIAIGLLSGCASEYFDNNGNKDGRGLINCSGKCSGNCSDLDP